MSACLQSKYMHDAHPHPLVRTCSLCTHTLACTLNHICTLVRRRADVGRYHKAITSIVVLLLTSNQLAPTCGACKLQVDIHFNHISCCRTLDIGAVQDTGVRIAIASAQVFTGSRCHRTQKVIPTESIQPPGVIVFVSGLDDLQLLTPSMKRIPQNMQICIKQR